MMDFDIKDERTMEERKWRGRSWLEDPPGQMDGVSSYLSLWNLLG